MSNTELSNTFELLSLSAPVMRALTDVGYEAPTKIQAQIIPLIIEGRDVLGQAQTGTGKTAAFALPILSKIDVHKKLPQVLVLAPTRELAIQVAEAFQSYARHIPQFTVLPIYGGQDYSGQLRQLKRGVHVVVGTPGRVMDHMRRGTLSLSELKCLVLDEADEMLRMGFVDDVEWVLEQAPKDRQMALFSATLPREIRRIAQKYLHDPIEITVKVKTSTAETIRQRYWEVRGTHKLDALTRMLEVEPFDAMICFVRTKTATEELAEKLKARGFAATALNGDIAQKQRERTIEQLKKGNIDILVATDVAARGLDVDRISHVINYDIPYDPESYVHRIGRTGRAGRSGDAILFVAPREMRMLRTIERSTNQKITSMSLPTTAEVNKKRVTEFKERISETVTKNNLEVFKTLVEEFQLESDLPFQTIAAALAKMAQGDKPLIVKDLPVISERPREERREGDDRRDRRDRRDKRDKNVASRRIAPRTQAGMARFRIEVGHDHGVKPGNIVGAIANEAGLDSQQIGAIQINDDYSTVDLPDDLPKEVLKIIGKTWVAGQQLNISSSANFSNDKDDKKLKKSKKFDKRKKA